jgi:hypothetical protein
MASTNTDNAGRRTLNVPDWSFGIITSILGTEIPDRALQDALNVEFDEAGNLAPRTGLTELFATTFANRITSAYYFTSGAGEIGILYTTGSQLRIVETNGTGDANLTGALTLPSNNFWQWITYRDLAIGVNKATSGDNPVKVSTGAVAAALGGSPPKGKYIDLWENRVWIVSATEPNQLWGSELGDPEGWTTGANVTDAITIDVELDDGDQIGGLHATKDALYVWKRKRIYKVVRVAVDANNPQGLKIVIHSETIGCVSPYSIFPLFDDVVFLSDQGLAGLKLTEQVEDFRTALYSRNVAEIAKTPKTTEEIPAVLMPEVSQYWLSIPASISTRAINEAYVLDYLNIAEGLSATRWTRFDGLAAGTAYTSFPGASGKVYVVGAENAAGTHQLFTYVPRNANGPLNDNGEAYTKFIKTKAFTLDAPLVRKHFHKYGFRFAIMAAMNEVILSYYLDENPNKGGNESFTISGPTSGAIYDVSLWDQAEWDTNIRVPLDFMRRTRQNSSGQRGQSITFEISNTQEDQGFQLREMMLIYEILTERRVSDI